MLDLLSFDFVTLLTAYQECRLRPIDIIEEAYRRIEQDLRKGIWISVRPREEAVAEAALLDPLRIDEYPLFGLPFAVKDNIDVKGLPTTAACAEYGYLPKETAHCIIKLRNAGAIFLGKTNLDQFATGLVGVRSPYGECENSFDPRYISGGSSSGSAVAVALGLASFAIGTDTAGSGRVPAACNNIVGVKPTRGLVSTQGVVPACRSLDCVSVFALTVEDAVTVREVMKGFDLDDPYSRRSASAPGKRTKAAFRFGVPTAMEFYGDDNAQELYATSVATLISLGGERVEADFAPFEAAARLLYEGPWIAERWEALGRFHEKHADALLPITRDIIERGKDFTASDLFAGLHELESLKRSADRQWEGMDVLLVPTIASIFTRAEIAANPIELNSQLGHYTNFTNLLDCCAISVPSGGRANGLPFGVTFLGPAFADALVAEIAGRYHRQVGGKLGSTATELSSVKPATVTEPVTSQRVSLAVVGAHLGGEPLNHQLTERGAALLRTCGTAPRYALYALPATTPAKPGLIEVGDKGSKIEVEVWSMPEASFGSLVALVPKPLVIGTVILEDEERVKGFLCESLAVEGAEDISIFGGWRNYRKALVPNEH